MLISNFQVSEILCVCFIFEYRFIRCWDVKSAHEIYRITAGVGGLGSASDLCIWSLLALRYKLSLNISVCIHIHELD